MARIAFGLVWMSLVSCSAPDAAPRAGVPQWASTGDPAPVGISATPSEGVVAAEEPGVVTEASLRRAIQGQPSSEAWIRSTLELVAFLEQNERHSEALRALEEARVRADGATAIDVAAASVLRDLGRREESLSLLRFALERDPSAFGPGLLFETAELAWICGQFDIGRSALDAMRSQIEGAGFEKEHAAEVDSLSQGLSRGLPPRSFRVRDLLADLRGAPDPEHRLSTMLLLLGNRADVVAKACVVAVGDADPRVRAQGVIHATVAAEALDEFCAVALSDPDPRVRVAGARRCDALPAVERLSLLLPALAAETSADAFAAIDTRICETAGLGNPTTEADASDALHRAQIVGRRRKELDR